MDAAEMLRLELDWAKERLEHNPPHACRFCHFYDCSKNERCRCSCGKLTEILTIQIERLSAAIAALEQSEGVA